MKYYDKESNLNEEAFAQRLEQLDEKVGYCETRKELLSIRSAYYSLKRRYEESGSRNLNIEFAIMAINGILQEVV